MKANKELVNAITKLDLAVDLVKDALQEQIYQREDFFSHKTDRWKDGSNGDAYWEETDKIKSILTHVENNMDWAFDELNQLFEVKKVKRIDNLKI